MDWKNNPTLERIVRNLASAGLPNDEIADLIVAAEYEDAVARSRDLLIVADRELDDCPTTRSPT